ncbi:MAG: Fur family transcriptional regulator [Ignavibacteriales bacterium]
MDRARATQEFSGMGYRLTRQRAAILEVLSRTSRHLTAEQVYQRVRRKCPNTNLATVYRNLGLMAQEGIISKVNFGDERSRFEANREHHHHLVCLKCGKVRDMSECPVHIEEQFLEAAGFRLVHHQFEAFGYCEDCSGGSGE